MAVQALSAIPDISKPRARAHKGQPERYLREVVVNHSGDDCLYWPFGRDSWGYGKLTLNGRNISVHRFICERDNGPAPTSRHHAAHICGKGRLGCVNRHHMRWATPKENCADKRIYGTVNNGERNGAARLTEEQVREVMFLKNKMPQLEIARLFEVGRTTIRDVHDGKSWAWLFD